MGKRAYIILISFVLIMLVGGVAACSSSSSSINEDAVQEYADPETETTLQGLSENDLSKYTQYANADFKAALTQEKFDQVVAQINEELGVYQSKEFLRVEEESGYIIVHYRATYSKGGVGIRMVFDSDHLVAGQWFE